MEKNGKSGDFADERVYEKHESVPHNPKIADVSFRSRQNVKK